MGMEVRFDTEGGRPEGDTGRIGYKFLVSKDEGGLRQREIKGLVGDGMTLDGQRDLGEDFSSVSKAARGRRGIQRREGEGVIGKGERL